MFDSAFDVPKPTTRYRVVDLSGDGPVVLLCTNYERVATLFAKFYTWLHRGADVQIRELLGPRQERTKCEF